MSSELSKHLGTIEYMRLGREVQLLELNKEFTDQDKVSIKKYLQWKMEQAERLMNPPSEKSAFFSS